MATAITATSGSKKVVVRKRRKRKKKGKNYYFHQGTEKAIIRYNKTDDPSLKNLIYNEHIRAAFDKLAENIIHTFKFYYFDVSSEEVKNEVVSFLVLNIHKFKEGKGKAFSYFSIVAKNWLILNNNNNYKRYKQHTQLDSPTALASLGIGSDHDRQNDIEDANEFTDYLVKYMDHHLTNMFKKKRDIQIADAVMELFRRRENIENFNKKALYVLVREMTGYNTQHITKVINVMKKKYAGLHQEYYSKGEVTI